MGGQTAASLSASLSILGQRWVMREHESRHALAIAQQLGLPDIIGRILASRHVTVEEAEMFLKPTLRSFLPDPLHLKDMDKAARRMADAIEQAVQHPDRKIAIFGDYDVDGATSSALLLRYLRALGISPLVHIPDRIAEGYGPNTPALLALKAQGADLIITVDCGTMAFEPLRAAQEAGLDVIVVDHHKGDAQMPQAYAIVNPNRFDETSTHTQLAACGVTFLLLVAVTGELRKRQFFSRITAPDLLGFLDLVALGTICDVVPLTGANHALVAQGLKVMASRGNKGIAAVMDVARLNESPGTYHAGFIIGPRINAGGRVGKSDLGVRLLASEDADEVRAIAAELDVFNAERKAIEAGVQEEAMHQALALPQSDAAIIVAAEGWHPGVIGIVAGRLKEHFHKPTAVIALKDRIGKASARSVSGIDLGAQVIAAVQAGHLLGGGGHAMAAGFTVSSDKITALRDFFNQRLASHPVSRERVLALDGTVSVQGLTVELLRLIEQAGPFGAGHPSVRLILPAVRIVASSLVGDGHVRAIIIDNQGGGASLKAMAFRSANTPLGEALLNPRGRIFNLAGQGRINAWQGRESVDFFIDDATLCE